VAKKDRPSGPANKPSDAKKPPAATPKQSAAAAAKVPPPGAAAASSRAPTAQPAAVKPADQPQQAVQDVNAMPVVSASVAAQIKAAVGVSVGAAPGVARAAIAEPKRATKPGSERWPVKTGTDADVGKVAAKIVPTTVEEMISIPRPADMPTPTEEYRDYENHRAATVETTIWRIDVHITALKQESDGDYHLVLQGASGETMIGEIPTPRPPFVGKTSPWLANIAAARSAVDDKLLKHVATAKFVPMQGKLVPRESMTVQPEAVPNLPDSFTTPEAGLAGPEFKTRIEPTAARITGVGFFDKVHGQMGVSQSNGIELHPILKIEWL
jgi:hypothetical protein